ncbi:fatty acid--CoA ligase family protein [Bacteroidota bacterium]
MHIDFLIENFKDKAHELAIIWHDKYYTYQYLLDNIQKFGVLLKEKRISSGEIVGLIGDYTPNSISLLLALIENNNIIAPFNNNPTVNNDLKYQIAQIGKFIEVDLNTDEISFSSDINNNITPCHDFYLQLRKSDSPGLVLFTSGTSGQPKGAVHNFTKLLEKFKTKRKSLRTVNFLLFDHWGGLNTLFHTISNTGVVLATKKRNPKDICEFIQKFKIELLPVSPTFLNLLILSEVYKEYDLSSLLLISYGTEPMPINTLTKSKSIFPDVKFQQTYGLIELGVLRSKSKSDDSLWVKVGGEGFDLRVVDNILQIKADSAMLGYLNAPSPFTEDGYFITGDFVEQDGEYLKIIGRKSEIINVGGEKVYPQEIENVILDLENVLEVTVYGEKHAITGNIVCARISLKNEEDNLEFIKRLKTHCRTVLQKFMVPVKIVIEDGPLYNDRFKKVRN